MSRPEDEVVIRTEREGVRVRIVPQGCLDLPHLASFARGLADVEASLTSCLTLDVDLSAVSRIDGAGAVVVARFLDRMHARGASADVVEERNPKAARLVALYRDQAAAAPIPTAGQTWSLARLGSIAARTPFMLTNALDFTGKAAIALPAAAIAPRWVDWRSLPRLLQSIGADGLPVTGAANLLVGLIIGFLGVSQLRRFGATAYVPELVVVAQLRELGPLVTAIVVAGRSGAGLASEIATMKVSEEIDALRSMGFDPIRWLVVPRCVALVLSVPMLTWIGHFLALGGGLAATTALTTMSPRAYLLATANAITASHFISGMVKTPFLALSIGLIACQQGLATYGGAAAVGARTTSAVVLSIFGVIVISALFTGLFVVAGV
jgi:phospholipid/cholesterol/gamma-HCH transport system permease protein